MNTNITARLTPVNNYTGNIHHPLMLLEFGDMDTKANRRRHLLRIIETRFKGNSGQCADFLGIKRPQLSRWITSNESSRQGISEESARNIERRLGLESGYLDMDEAPPAEPGAVAPELVSAWQQLTEQQRHAFLDKVMEQAQTNQAILEQLTQPATTIRVRERELQKKAASRPAFLKGKKHA